ncbi:MAG TPA: transcription antitermination factor NusB [Mycobacteriales bacterium]|nr:transcription antitermination factor NusB [Mycobacteriales bacterium]
MAVPPTPPTRPARRPPSPDRPRLLAWRLLRAVDEQDAYANLVLPELLRESALDERDRAFTSELGYGTLRALGTLDHVISLCSSRPVADIDPPLRDVLRLGVYQLLRTRVPPHAAVSATVELARSVAGEGPGSFANAVLRKVAARGGDLGAPAYDDDPTGHLAITTAHPRWIVEEFVTALDGDVAEAQRALAADDARPEVHLVARPGRLGRDALLDEVTAAGLTGVPGPWSPWSVRLRGGDPAGVPAVRDGRAAVQDEGSQLAAVLAAALLPQGDPTVLDMCAGPGGKGALLAATMAGRGSGRLVATELHEHRARLTARALRDGGGHPARPLLTVCADARTAPWRPGGFDLVLLDAPCSGLGSLRRRPESRWRRQPADVAALGTLQDELLTAAVAALRPGGHLVYVVCSPVVAEGRARIDRLLRYLPGEVTAIDVRGHLPTIPTSGPGPTVQLWPHRHGTDAIFLSAVRRVATLPPSDERLGER